MLSIVLFVSCLIRVFVPLENFSLLWRRHHNRWRTAKFDPCPAHMTIEQWGFFNMPHLLWHGAWSSPRTRDTHTHCQAFGSWAVTTCFYDLGPSRLEFEHPTFRSRAKAIIHWATVAVSIVLSQIYWYYTFKCWIII